VLVEQTAIRFFTFTFTCPAFAIASNRSKFIHRQRTRQTGLATRVVMREKLLARACRHNMQRIVELELASRCHATPSYTSNATRERERETTGCLFLTTRRPARRRHFVSSAQCRRNATDRLSMIVVYVDSAISIATQMSSAKPGFHGISSLVTSSSHHRTMLATSS